MVRFFVLFASILLFANSAFAFNINYNNDLKNNYRMSNLNRTEAFVMGKNNYNLAPNARLALMEQKLFGTVQSGSFDDRINFINKVLVNANNAQMSSNLNKLRKLNRIKQVFNDTFNGSMTGYTPQVYFPQNQQFYYHNTTIPQPFYDHGIGNFITQTRVIIDD